MGRAKAHLLAGPLSTSEESLFTMVAGSADEELGCGGELFSAPMPVFESSWVACC